MQSAIWSTADQYLRHVVEEDYGDNIIPFTVLRRLERLLAETKTKVLEFLGSTKLTGPMLDMTIQRNVGLHFYNGSPFNLKKIASTDNKVLEWLNVYVAGFSDSIRDVRRHFKIMEREATLVNAVRLWG